MAPKPDSDLFIEPASDEDVVYGDYNGTMDGASSSGPRPYIRLTSQLRNATREVGGEVRFKCEAIGTPPLSFTWLKNNAPLEKSRRVRVRQKDNLSRLAITELDVLDSGYYQCIASNTAASVNTTSILRVNNVPDVALKSRKGGKTHTHTLEDYEDYELMDRGRLPDEEDADFMRVPDSAGGAGFAPMGSSERWLDGIKFRVGDCVPYRGEACRQYLSGRHIMLTSENREDIYDIDRNLLAAMMFIKNSPTVSPQCRKIPQAVACYHMYKVCEGRTSGSTILSVCKSDCDRIQNEVCPSELALAAQHELVGDGPKALFPQCSALSPSPNHCIPVLDNPMAPSSSDHGSNLIHWCYVDSGKKYEGIVDKTESGKKCMDWAESTSRDYNVDKYPELLRHARNHCRNPGGIKTKPWCYSQPLGQEEYCDIPQCPKNMFTHLSDTTREQTTSSPTSPMQIWDGLSQHWQLAIVGGGVFLSLLLLLLFCCACCCRSKKKSHKNRAAPTHVTLHSSAPPSVINSAANSAYYRKLNGTSTPILGRGGGPMEMNSLLPHNGLGVPPPYADPYRPPVEPVAYEIPVISAQQLKKMELIGEGQFGVVHTGNWLTKGEREPITVAIKSLRAEATNAEKNNFQDEVRTVASFDHPHVVRLLGICYLDGVSMSAVFEYMVHGDLHDFLRLRSPHDHGDHERIQADNDDFMKIATQIAYGMEYLSSMSFVHRDLATRNCLVGDQRIIKIADFGLMRSCYENDYYRMQHRAWMPVRWMAKEALEQGRADEATDVWSFGVTLWEIWSYGKHPYENRTNQQVMDLIASRHLLECPHNCPTNIYSLMVECWHENPARRPTFVELHRRLQGWSVASPAHSILHNQRASASSHSGSSGSARPHQPTNKQMTSLARNSAYQSSRPGRRNEDASPLMRREANYAYSEDGDSD